MNFEKIKIAMLIFLLTTGVLSKEKANPSILEGDWNNSETKSAIRFRFVYKGEKKRISVMSITSLDRLVFHYAFFKCRKRICKVFDEKRHKIIQIQIISKEKFKCLYFVKLKYANPEGKFQKYVDVPQAGRIYSKSENIRDDDWDGKTER